MNSLSEYNSNTTRLELYFFLSQAIIHNEIMDFSALLSFANDIPLDKKTVPVFKCLFILIRKLYWGFFRDIDHELYPKVWKQMVLPHKKFPNCGDLKRNLTITNIFVGILDLHGYTGFCNKYKNKLSMLKRLDELIQNEMTKLARNHDVVLQRRNGDEMVLVGTTATDLIALTLDIIEIFSGQKNTKSISKDINSNCSLPPMHISAGIAGGNKYTPFIITLDGDLSGGVVNTAARLQSRANILSQERSNIVVARTVQTGYLAERKNGPHKDKEYPVKCKSLDFIDSGYIRFKGVDVAVSEVLFDERDQYRIQVEKDLTALIKAITNESWKKEIFVSLLVLFYHLYKFMPPFCVDPKTLEPGACGDYPASLTNDSLSSKAKEVLTTFREQHDYLKAVEGLGKLVGYSKYVPGFDPLSLEYAELIVNCYTKLIAEFKKRLDRRVCELAKTALPSKQRHLYEECCKAVTIKEQLDRDVFSHLPGSELSRMWWAAIEDQKNTLDLAIYSGKK